MEKARQDCAVLYSRRSLLQYVFPRSGTIYSSILATSLNSVAAAPAFRNVTGMRELIWSALTEVLGGLIAMAVAVAGGWLWNRLRQRTGGGRGAADRAEQERRRGRYALLVGSAAVLGCAVWSELVGPALSESLVYGRTATLITTHRWITYDPPGSREWGRGIRRADASSVPRAALIRQELGWIRRAGFDGIITFTSRGSFGAIPRLAKEQGLSVIMGVWDPTDWQEVVAAVAQRDYVDAYCVGHDGLKGPYVLGDLVPAIRYVRFHTGRPVTTTEKLDRYLDSEELLRVGDWVFPDAHLSIKESTTTYRADMARDTQQIIDWARRVAARREREGKPILLKMVSYPSAGIANASPAEQAAFFTTIFEIRRDVMSDIPGDVSISVHSAFDMPWKTGWPFYEWEPYTGLLDDDGTPRPAAREIVKRLP